MTPVVTRSVVVAIVLAIGSGCTASRDRSEGSPPAGTSHTRATIIDHLTPRRDSVGGIPTRYAWTAIEGADFYMLGVWNEVDVLIWRADNLRTPSIDWPAGARLEAGTYFWSVTAMRDDRPIAESGRAAFVVR